MPRRPPPPPVEDHYTTDDDTNVYIEDSSLSSKADDNESSSVSNRDLIESSLRPSRVSSRRHEASEPIVFPGASLSSSPSKSWHRTVILIIILMVAALAAGVTLPLLLIKKDGAINTVLRPWSRGAGNITGDDLNETTVATEPPLPVDEGDASDLPGDDAQINTTEPVNATDPPLEPTTAISSNLPSSQDSVAPVAMWLETSVPVATNSVTTAPTSATMAKPSTSMPQVDRSMSPSANPSLKPQPQPTTTPTTSFSTQLLPLVRSVSVVPEHLENTTTPEGKAMAWMRTTNQFETIRIIQRYAITTMVYGLNMLSQADGIIMDAKTDECAWDGISCNEDGIIVAIQWSGRQRLGRLPDDIGLLSSLTMLDLGENMIVGEIPAGLFSLKQLEYLFLQNNLLHGKLSTLIGELVALRKIFLGSNSLTGTIPRELGTLNGSTAARPLEWISFCNNSFNGTIPVSLNLSHLYYLDLGRNRLSGSIPLDWAQGGMNSIRTLYVDYNSLSGELPEALLSGLGNGGIEQLVLNDNQFTGEFPVHDSSSSSSRLRTLELHNNGFDKLNKDICQLSIFESQTGTISIFKADCSICECDFFCDTGRCIE